MGLRELDDTGWDDLPGGLSFSDDDGDDDEPPAPRRRGLRALVWLVVLGVVLGGGAVWGARWMGEADVRAVLASSTPTYSAVIERLREAPDAAALSAVAADAPRAAERLSADLDQLSAGGGSRRQAVRAQVDAEREVLLAVAALSELDRAPLRVWGEGHADLDAAVRREDSTRSALRVADPAAARRLPDTAAAVRSVASTVGRAVVGDVTQAAADLLGELEGATTTAQLRETAAQADGQRTAVAAAAQGLRPGPDAAVLAAFGDALLAVAELSALTPDGTGTWPPVRSRLQSSLRVVADADSGVAAGTVRGRLPLVLDALDRLVERAQQAHAEWRARHDAAAAAQAADAAALRVHGERVRSGAAGWPAVRAAVEDLARADDPAPEAVDDAWAAADGVRRTLSAPSPPEALAEQHAALLEAAAAVEAPLRRARDDPSSTGETGSAAAALPAWDAALAAWEAALAEAEAEVESRALPPPPDV